LVVIKVLQCLISYPNIMEIKSAMSKWLVFDFLVSVQVQCSDFLLENMVSVLFRDLYYGWYTMARNYHSSASKFANKNKYNNWIRLCEYLSETSSNFDGENSLQCSKSGSNIESK
jgi:hypothetical protein